MIIFRDCDKIINKDKLGSGRDETTGVNVCNCAKNEIPNVLFSKCDNVKDIILKINNHIFSLFIFQIFF